jgi:DNA/RNA endonuclease YhcR with UshA esterase domain
VQINFSTMQRRVALIVILLGSFFIFQTSFSANSDVVINEIGAYQPSGHEWIEIWNKGNESVDMTGWKFWESETNHNLSVSTTDAVVEAGEYAVIVQDAFKFLLDYPNFSGSVFDSSWSSLNESGEMVGLKDAEGNFTEQFTYIAAPHFSLQRIDPFLADYTAANWSEHANGNTVGALNVFNTQTTSPTSDVVTTTQSSPDTSVEPTTEQVQQIDISAIKINEFVSDPEEGNEWVELYNTSLVPVDMTGSLICDNRNTTSTCKKISGNVDAHGWLFVDLQTKSFLNNGGDSVILKNSLGALVDKIEYEDVLVPDRGQSTARIVDGVDTDNESGWAATNQITPGLSNIISVSVSSTSAPNASSTSSSKTTKKTSSIFVWNVLVPASADIGEQVMLNGENVADPRGGRLSFVWTQENGERFVGPEYAVRFASSGVHTVSLFVTSTSGYGEEKKFEITVGSGLSLNADVIISEIFPNPDGDDTREFIELKNNSAGVVDLSGWMLRAQNKIYTFLDHTIIAPFDFLVFYKSATKLNLVNTHAKVELLNRDKALVDLVKYEKPISGKSYVFTEHGWQWGEASPGESAAQTVVSAMVEKNANTSVKKGSVKLTGALVTNIADVREAAKGQPARLSGIVSVEPGVFGSQYFYLNNETSGIQIYQSKKDFPPLKVGDSITVAGTVSESNGIKRVNIKNSESIDILSTHNNVPPRELQLDEIDDALLGGLVQVEGEMTEIKSSFMYVDDGLGEVQVYFKKNAGIDKSKLKEGERVQVTGILEKVNGKWQLLPRGNEDIEPVQPVEGEVLGEKIAENKPRQYGAITFIGLGLLAVLFIIKTKSELLAVFLKKAASVWTKKP